MEGIQEKDPSDQEPEECCERVSYSESGMLRLPGIPWVPIPGGIVVVPLDNARSVHGTLSIRCEAKVGDETGGRNIR